MAESFRETSALYDVTDREDVGKYTMAVTVMLTGVQAHRIRRYEQAGLLRPIRSEARQRRYSDSEIGLIRSIADLLAEATNIVNTGITGGINLNNIQGSTFGYCLAHLA